MSRLRIGTTRIFECYVQVDGVRVRQGNGVQPQVVKMLPDTYEEEALRMIPKFCFPCEYEHVESTSDPQKFTFVLTDLDGKHQFGYCRMAPDYSHCLCFLSYMPWTELFYGLLDKIGSLRECGQGALEEPLLHAVYERDLPRPGEVIYVVPKGVQSGQPFQLTCPDTTKLPSIPDNWNLTEYYTSISAHNILALFASMLYERRILVTSKKLSLITACVQGASLLLYPLHWQHIYIPVMPAHLCDYCCAPMPFLIGIHASLMDQVRKMPLDEVVILDVDENTVELPAVFNDLGSMPEAVVRTLKHIIKKHTSGIDDIISKAFVVAFAAMIGDYRDSFKRREDGKICFDQDGFVENHSEKFFRELIQFQHFQQFVSERVDVLNQGKGINDIFEHTVAEYRELAGRPNLSARSMASKAKSGVKKAFPAMKYFASQARLKAKVGMKALKKKSSRPKESVNSDSDTETERSQSNGSAGVSFGNRHSSVGSTNQMAVVQRKSDRANSVPKRPPPAIPAPYALYKELKKKECQRPRSNDLAKSTSTTSIDGPGGDAQKQREMANERPASLMSFSPDTSPPTTAKLQKKPRTEVADLLCFSNPAAQFQPVRHRSASRTGSISSWGDFPLEGDITGSFSADLMKEFDSQQGSLAGRKILLEWSSDELVSTASSSDDEDAAEAPPVPPRPDESDLAYFSGGLPPPAYPPPPLELESAFSSTNPFCVMGMAPSIFPESTTGLPTLPSRPPAPRQYQDYQSPAQLAYQGNIKGSGSSVSSLNWSSTGGSSTGENTPHPFALLEAQARESHRLSQKSPMRSRETSPLASSAFNSDIHGGNVVMRTNSAGKRDSPQREVVVSTEWDHHIFDPLSH